MGTRLCTRRQFAHLDYNFIGHRNRRERRRHATRSYAIPQNVVDEFCPRHLETMRVFLEDGKVDVDFVTDIGPLGR